MGIDSSAEQKEAGDLGTRAVRNEDHVAREAADARHNYWVTVGEGAFFSGSLNFVNATTILPTIILTLGGSSWLVSSMPIAMLVGFYVPPIFTAPWVASLRRYKPVVMAAGLGQRLPYGLAAVALFWGHKVPVLALIAVALVPVISGVSGGVTLTAWQQLFAKVIPEPRRHSVFALRLALGCVMGMGVGRIVKYVLGAWPGPPGYAFLHMGAFLGLMISYAIFSQTREPAQTVSQGQTKPDLGAHFRSVPGLLRSDRHFRLFLGAIFFRNGMFILTPFLAIHCLQDLGRPASYLGYLLTVQMLGAIAGNAIAGSLGHRWGSKATLGVGILAFAALAGWSAAAHTSFQWQVIFFLLGFAGDVGGIGVSTLTLEMGPPALRTTYLALALLVNLPAMLMASWLSASLWQAHQLFGALVVLAIASHALALAFLIPMREPRGPRQTA